MQTQFVAFVMIRLFLVPILRLAWVEVMVRGQARLTCENILIGELVGCNEMASRLAHLRLSSPIVVSSGQAVSLETDLLLVLASL